MAEENAVRPKGRKPTEKQPRRTALAEVWKGIWAGWLTRLSQPALRDSLFWLIVLAGITPALMSNLISPLEWPRVALAPAPFAFPPVDDFIRLAALVLAVLGASLAVSMRRYWHLALLLPLVLYAVLGNDPSGSAYFATHAAYNVASFLIALGFVLSGQSRLRSLYFVVYLVLLVAISFVDPVIWFYQIVLFLCLVVVARFVTLFVKHNTALFRQLGWGRTLRVAGTAFLMWVPILIFLGPGQVANMFLSSAIEDYLYTIEPLSFLNNARDPATGNVPRPRDLRNDVIVAFDLATDFHETEIDQRLAELGTLTDETMAQMPDRGTEIVRQLLPPDPLLNNPGCGGFNVLCWIRHAIVGGINKGYSNLREHELANVHAQLTALAEDRNRDAQSKIAEAKARLAGVMARVNSAMKTSTLFAIRSFDAFNLVFNLLLVLAAIKSYLHVFARFAFAPGTETTVSLRDPGTSAGRRGTITKQGRQYRVPGTNRKTFYYARQLVAEGRAGDFAIPQWRTAILPRLVSFKYAMNRARFGGHSRPGDNGNNAGAVVFKVTEPSELVEWELAANEQVVFHMNDLAAMTEDICLGTIVSFRLSTLLLGRIVFHRATGPGILLLRCHGEPTVTGNKDVRLNRPVELHVAWERRASFEVHAARDIVNIYMSGVNLASAPGDRVVIERAADKQSVSTGIVRFIRDFLLPF